jgi:hypothetical protein
MRRHHHRERTEEGEREKPFWEREHAVKTKAGCQKCPRGKVTSECLKTVNCLTYMAVPFYHDTSLYRCRNGTRSLRDVR